MTGVTENRWSRRRTTNIPARLYRNEELLAESTIGNFSLEGAFFRDDALALTPNAYIDIAFGLEDRQGVVQYRLPAMVRHVDQHGVGIMFLHFDVKTYRHIQYVLYEKPRPETPWPRAEQRWSPRKPVRLDITLYEQNKRVVEATTGNLALEGMFVQTTYSPAIRSALELEFQFGGAHPRPDQRPADSGRFRVPCQVRHRNARGLGLMFTHFQLPLYHAVRHLLYDHGPESAIHPPAAR